jgi:hypothetical protein
VLQFDPNPHLLAKLAHADVADGWMATFVFFQKKKVGSSIVLPQQL